MTEEEEVSSPGENRETDEEGRKSKVNTW